MANTKVRLPDDAANTGKYIRYNDRSVGGFTVLELHAILQDITNDQQAGITAKGLQAPYGLGVQDLKDAGRVIFSCASAIAGVTAVTTEALVTMIPQRDGTATGTVTAQTVTSGKRLRLTNLVCGCISSGASVLSGRVSLRMHPTTLAAASPIITTCALSVPAALAQMGDWCVVPIPDGVEFSGTMQFGISQIFNATTGTVWASGLGFEY